MAAEADQNRHDARGRFQCEPHFHADVIDGGVLALVQDFQPSGADDDQHDGRRGHLRPQQLRERIAQRNALVVVEDLPARQPLLESLTDELDGIGAVAPAVRDE
jgi:hypothetical protein